MSSENIYETVENVINDLNLFLEKDLEKDATNVLAQFYLEISNLFLNNNVSPHILANALLHTTAITTTFAYNGNVFSPTEEEILHNTQQFFNMLKNIKKLRNSHVNSSLEVH